jgi:hypothetical protein
MKKRIIGAISRFLAILVVTLIIQSIYLIGHLSDLFGASPSYIQLLAIVCIITLVMNPLEPTKND